MTAAPSPVTEAPAVMGLDLSLDQPAAVILSSRWDPADAFNTQWKQGWRLISHALRNLKTPETLSDEICRMNDIATFMLALAERYGAGQGSFRVFIEDYAFSRNNTRLAELGGQIKVLFWRAGMIIQPVPVSSARKTLLGVVPQKKTSGVDVKDYVNNELAKMGAKFQTMDEGDAFVIANHGRALLGLPHLGMG